MHFFENCRKLFFSALIFSASVKAQNTGLSISQDIAEISKHQTAFQIQLAKDRANRNKSTNSIQDDAYRSHMNLYIYISEYFFVPSVHGYFLKTPDGYKCLDFTSYLNDKDFECQFDSKYFDNSCNLFNLIKDNKHKEFLGLISTHLKPGADLNFRKINIKDGPVFRNNDRLHFSNLSHEFLTYGWLLSSRIYNFKKEFSMPTSYIKEHLNALEKPDKLKADDLFQLAFSNILESGPYDKINSEYEMKKNKVFDDYPELIPTKEKANDFFQQLVNRKDAKSYQKIYARFIMSVYDKSAGIEEDDVLRLNNALLSFRRVYNTGYNETAFGERRMLQACLIAEIADCCLHLSLLDPANEVQYYNIALKKYIDFIKNTDVVDEAGSF
jgi:hypothetical protein